MTKLLTTWMTVFTVIFFFFCLTSLLMLGSMWLNGDWENIGPVAMLLLKAALTIGLILAIPATMVILKIERMN